MGATSRRKVTRCSAGCAKTGAAVNTRTAATTLTTCTSFAIARSYLVYLHRNRTRHNVFLLAAGDAASECQSAGNVNVVPGRTREPGCGDHERARRRIL